MKNPIDHVLLFVQPNIRGEALVSLVVKEPKIERERVRDMIKTRGLYATSKPHSIRDRAIRNAGMSL